jgi:hypothetical protein
MHWDDFTDEQIVEHETLMAAYERHRRAQIAAMPSSELRDFALRQLERFVDPHGLRTWEQYRTSPRGNA